MKMNPLSCTTLSLSLSDFNILGHGVLAQSWLSCHSIENSLNRINHNSALAGWNYLQHTGDPGTRVVLFQVIFHNSSLYRILYKVDGLQSCAKCCWQSQSQQTCLEFQTRLGQFLSKRGPSWGFSCGFEWKDRLMAMDWIQEIQWFN